MALPARGFESPRCRFDHLRIVVGAGLKTRSALRGKDFSLGRNTARYLWTVLIQYLKVGGGGRVCVGGYVDEWVNGDVGRGLEKMICQA